MFSIIASRTLCFASVLLTQDAAPLAEPISKGFPPQPEFVLAARTESPPPDGETEPVIQRIEELTALADKSTDVRVRSELRLAAADLTLGEQLEPVATRSLLGLDFGHQRQEALDAAVAAKRWIDETAKTLDGIDPSGGDNEEWLSQRQEEVQRLGAFGDALAAYLTPAGDDSAYRRLRTAASGLSVMLEASDQRIAGAASLWQAALFLNAGLADRALALLEPALAAPPTKHVRPAFFARLLRCRAIAEQQRYTTALALLFQLEERCEEWFPVQADRGDALRAVTIVEWQVLRDWHESLDADSHAPQRQWCADKATAFLQERFTDETRAILRLGRSVPLIAAVPDAAAPHAPRPAPEAPEKDQAAREGD